MSYHPPDVLGGRVPMDKKIDGALGGSALKYFRVHVDYPRGLAVFDKL